MNNKNQYQKEKLFFSTPILTAGEKTSSLTVDQKQGFRSTERYTRGTQINECSEISGTGNQSRININNSQEKKAIEQSLIRTTQIYKPQPKMENFLEVIEEEDEIRKTVRKEERDNNKGVVSSFFSFICGETCNTVEEEKKSELEISSEKKESNKYEGFPEVHNSGKHKGFPEVHNSSPTDIWDLRVIPGSTLKSKKDPSVVASSAGLKHGSLKVREEKDDLRFKLDSSSNGSIQKSRESEDKTYKQEKQSISKSSSIEHNI